MAPVTLPVIGHLREEIRRLEEAKIAQEQEIEELRKQLKSAQSPETIAMNLLDGVGDDLAELFQAAQLEKQNRATKSNFQTLFDKFWLALEEKYKLHIVGEVGKVVEYDTSQHRQLDKRTQLASGSLVEIVQIGWQLGGKLVEKPLVKPAPQKTKK